MDDIPDGSSDHDAVGIGDRMVLQEEFHFVAADLEGFVVLDHMQFGLFVDFVFGDVFLDHPDSQG